MVLYLGIDDTDGKSWMCTTYLAIEVLRRLKGRASLAGYPRLVRLNPNVPWKTRGNGAICLPLVSPERRKFKVGESSEGEIWAFFGKDPEKEVVFEVAKEAVNELYDKEDEETRPGIVISDSPGPEEFYWKAVRGVIKLEEAIKICEKLGAIHWGIRGGRGRIGALAAICWPRKDVTYELLTYKSKKEWKVRGKVEDDSVKELDSKLPGTFDNYDYENEHPCILPRALTPVLYGVRGERPEELPKALEIVKCDPKWKEWIIFETNQGTDDHIVRRKISEMKPFSAGLLEGEVISRPKIIEGGHVIFRIKDESGEIDCAAYEPTKGFRKLVLKLIPGDFVRVWGSVSSYPGTLNLEKIQVIRLEPIYEKENPICPKCGKRMKHLGRGKGYRCPKCKFRLPEGSEKIRKVEREIFPGIYEVPPSARRHLAMPLKRGVKVEPGGNRHRDRNNSGLGGT